MQQLFFKLLQSLFDPCNGHVKRSCQTLDCSRFTGHKEQTFYQNQYLFIIQIDVGIIGIGSIHLSHWLRIRCIYRQGDFRRFFGG